MRGKTLVVSGIPESLTEENLYDLFDAYGPIEDVRLKLHEETRASLGYGEVVFFEAEDARLAEREVDGLEIEGGRLSVRPALLIEELPGDDELDDLLFVAEGSLPPWGRRSAAG